MITETIPTLTREEQLIRLYQTTFPAVAAFVCKKNGSLDEAKDVFQEALLIYYEKQLHTDFLPDHDEQYYIKGIARHLWYKKFRQNLTQVPLPDEFKLQAEEQEPKISETLFRYMEASGKKCLELLRSFYYDKLNMKEIAAKFGFSGERSATAQKYKCLEKVRNELKQRSLSREDFYE